MLYFQSHNIKNEIENEFVLFISVFDNKSAFVSLLLVPQVPRPSFLWN